jgi:hypothetical protein
MFNKLNLSAEVIVVGSGPGGATVARELSKQGKDVLLLERGYDHRGRFYYGTYFGAIGYTDRFSLLFTEEGLNIKLNIQPLPEHLRGNASTRIAQAAQGLGYNWFPQPKFMVPERCKDQDKSFNCQASCMLGCRCGAKWNAAEWVDEAIANGTRLKKGTRVHKVLFEDGHAIGVAGSVHGRKFTASAETIILAAGGIGSPRILQSSGLNAAGVGMTMDTTVMIYGASREKGTGREPPMTWSWENPDAGYLLSTLTDPWLLYPLAAIRKGIGPALRWLQWHKMLGVMIKLKDDISGGIYPDGKIRKPMTAGDNERLNHAYEICKKILISAGAKKSSIFMRPFIGTHPSGRPLCLRRQCISGSPGPAHGINHHRPRQTPGEAFD